ncbi:MAG: right-handed parallel beta-helix repeat-containing protein [Anaerolineales bacterium]|jgi:parallel beta-helix repeat protein
MAALMIVSVMLAVSPVQVAHAATFVVDDSGDAGDSNLLDGNCDDGGGNCTLRAAMEQANYVNDTDLIQFSGNMTITLGSTLPTITEPVTIDGTGYDIVVDANAAAGNGFTINADNVTIQGLELDDPQGDGIYASGDSNILIKDMLLVGTGDADDGIHMNAATNVTIEDSFIYGFTEYGINIAGGSTGVDIDNNYIGIQADGTTDDGNTLRGIRISSSPSATITDNLISGNDDGGILISGTSSDGTTITGNYIGTDYTGTVAVGNSGQGIQVSNAPNTQIGGNTSVEENLISGNTSSGVYVSGTDSAGTMIQGNLIGTDWEGEATIPNTLSGVRLNGTVNVTVGGNSSSEGNIISGNGSIGVYVYNGADNNTIINNIIGLDVNGDTDLGNTGVGLYINGSTNTIVLYNTISENSSHGIRISNTASSNSIQSNRIGLSQSGSVALGNGGSGVYILDSPSNAIDSNTIAYNNGDGIGIEGATSISNPITSNSIYSNGGLGIDLIDGGSDVTVNDGPGDPDAGPNTLQNFPVFTAQIEGSGVRISGIFESGPYASRLTYDLQFFVSDYCDGMGHGEGETHIGTLNNVQLNTSDQATINYLISSAGVTEGQFITATATYDEGAGGLKDTSEFSACAVVQPESSSGSSGVFVVNNTGNGADATPGDEICEVTAGVGNCTLRAAIQEANAGTAPPYTIAFALSSPYTITPTSALTPIYTPVIIDGRSQPGYSGSPIVTIDGSALGSGHGLRVYSDDVEIRSLSIINFSSGAGVYITNTNATVEDSYIGVETDGSTLSGNQTGIYVNNIDSALILDNLISGNGDGIRLVGALSNTNVIQGNMIGTDLGGTLDYGNTDDGISVEGGSGNLIGGTGSGQGNTISGNNGDGIEITGGATSNLVYGNYIGARGSGSGSLPNGAYGLNINGGSNNRITNDNVIAYNGNSGVYVINGSSTGNLITSSSIYSNTTLDIELASGGNNSQAAPGLTGAFQGPSYTYVEGFLNAAPSTIYIIDLYSSPPTAPGPPVKTYQKSFFVITDGAGYVAFSNSFTISLALLDQVYATASDLSNNTSQFCGSVLVVTGAPVLTNTPTNTSSPPTSTNTSANTATNTSSGSGSSSTNTPVTSTTTNTPSGPTNTYTPVGPAQTLTAMADTSTPTQDPSITVTATPWWITPTGTITGTIDPTMAAIMTEDASGGESEELTLMVTSSATSEFGLSSADLTATADASAVDDGGGEDDGGGGLSILLWVFIGLAVLFLFAGGAMELIRWLRSRQA